MMKRLGFSFVVFLLAARLASIEQIASAEQGPNIIVLFADDLGYGELNCQGNATDIPTPHIDSIAANGVRFTAG